jgi:hypothetical protein
MTTKGKIILILIYIVAFCIGYSIADYRINAIKNDYFNLGYEYGQKALLKDLYYTINPDKK